MFETPVISPEENMRDRLRAYELERERMWEEHLFANPHVNASLKLTLRAVWFSLPHSPEVEYRGIFIQVELWRLAQSIGVSTHTLGRQLKQLVELGVVARQEETVKLENGQRRTRVWLALLELADYPEGIRPEVSKNGHGGERVKVTCQHCGSEALYLESRVVCAHCEQQNGPTRIVPLNPPPEAFDMPEEVDAETFFADVEEDTVKRPIVLPVVQAEQAAPRSERPDVPCYFCAGKGKAWRWMADKEDGWICSGCWSSLAATLHNRDLEGWK